MTCSSQTYHGPHSERAIDEDITEENLIRPLFNMQVFTVLYMC